MDEDDLTDAISAVSFPIMLHIVDLVPGRLGRVKRLGSINV